MNKLETLADRIKYARTEKGMTQSTLATKSGLKQSDISKLEIGTMKSTTAIVKMANALGCSVSWLDSGKGDPWPSSSNGFGDIKLKAPILGSAKLGDEECYFSELEYPTGIGDGYIIWPTKDPDAYSLRCKGNSMLPRIRHGEFVVIEPNHPIIPGDEVVVRDTKGRVMVKQFTYDQNGMFYFSSVNQTYAPFGIPKEEIKLIHYVAGIAKASLLVEE